MALCSPISEPGVGWSCFHVAMITSPPKIPAFAFSGSSVLTGSPPMATKRNAPMDTRPRIGGLISGSTANAPFTGGSASIAQTRSRRARLKRIPLSLTQELPRARSAPLPLVGRGWGWGSLLLDAPRATTTTPTPPAFASLRRSTLPTRGRVGARCTGGVPKPTEFAARADSISTRPALVPRTRSSHTFATSPIANFGFKRGTRIIELLVSNWTEP
jgi:hypothetical protein